MTYLKVAAAGLVFLAVGFVAARAQGVPGDDQIAAKDGAITVHPIHHASLMLTWNGTHVLVDPVPTGANKADPVAEYKALPTPDVILVTHIHGDHFNAAILEAVAGSKTVIVAPHNVADALPATLKAKVRIVAMSNGDMSALVSIPDFTVQATAMQNVTVERAKFHPAGEGNGYIVSLGGKRIYIAGDTEETPELAKLAHIDAAFIPMNMPFTETVEAAAKWVKDFKPVVVYPYHFHNADGTLSDLAAFKKDVGSASDVRLLKWY